MPGHGRHPRRDLRDGKPANRERHFISEGPQHEVAIKAFALGKYDVTSEQFLTFLKETGYQPRPCSTILDMKWKSPGHGVAYSPLNGEPLRWPAVCLELARRGKIYRLAERQGPHRPPDPRSSKAASLPAEPSRKHAARAARRPLWGNDRRAASQLQRLRPASWGQWALSPRLSHLSRPTPSASTGCLATPGNGPPILAPQLHGRAADGSAWTEEACDKYVIRGGSWSNLPNFVRSAARSGSGRNSGEYDYSSLTGIPRCAGPAVIIAMRLSD